MTNPTVTQATRNAAADFLQSFDPYGHTYPDMRAGLFDAHPLVQAFAAHRELGKSEGYAQAVDDAVAKVDHFRNAYMNALIVAPESSALLSAIATCEHIIAALKDRTNG